MKEMAMILATAFVAITVLTSLKQTELIELQKKQIEAELKFLQRRENLWKEMSFLIKGIKSFNKVENKEKATKKELQKGK